MSHEVSVVLREYDQNEDQACIYATWRNAACYGVNKASRPKDEKAFFKEQTVLIRDILKTAQVRIACLEDHPMTIIGYSVALETHLEFIYVKIEFRGKGIGRLLMPKNIETVTPNLTKIGAIIVKKKKLKIKGEQDGSTEGTEGTEEIKAGAGAFKRITGAD